jgi:hypothetical protein
MKLDLREAISLEPWFFFFIPNRKYNDVVSPVLRDQINTRVIIFAHQYPPGSIDTILWNNLKARVDELI